MIVDAVIYVVVHVIGPFINSFMPHLSLGTLPTVAATVLSRLGAFLRLLTPIIPVGVVVSWVEVWLVVWLAAAGYIVFDWAWRHIPSIAGFGTGGGG